MEGLGAASAAGSRERDPCALENAGHRSPDLIRQRDNRRAGHTLCDRCEGTGNELFSMFKACSDCGGSVIKVWHGERSALVRRYLDWRSRRRLRAERPFNLNSAVRWRLSRWFGIGDWFADPKDACCRCGVWPSDCDFGLRRVRPFRAECLEREMCDEAVAENEYVNETRRSGSGAASTEGVLSRNEEETN